MKRSYDPRCEELARHFLGDIASTRMCSELAEVIQETVEDWMEEENDRLEIELEQSPAKPPDGGAQPNHEE